MTKQIIPATDWFYVENHDRGILIQHIAVWELTDENHIIGYYSDPAVKAPDEGCLRPALSMVPPATLGLKLEEGEKCGCGCYKHREMLSDEEREALKNKGHFEKKPSK